MKKYILSILIFAFVNLAAFAHVSHYDKYNYLEYELFRNDKLIGSHKYNFDRNLEGLKVKSIVEFKISKLGVDLYKYYAKSEEIYKKDVFYSFNSKTKQNKKDRYVNISLKDENNLFIDGSSYKGDGSRDLIVGTWWNHEIIKAKAQISAISGRIIYQNVEFIGKEEIKIGEKTFNALHFRFTSSDKTLPDNKKLDTHIWYEENSYLWLKAAFDKTGYWEYRIKTYN